MIASTLNSTEKTCPRCGGSGMILDDKSFGALMRDVRKRKGLSLREVAKRCKWSAAYVSDLELGKRGWNDAKHKRYSKAIGISAKTREEFSY
jgi:ribosome-binding protein aMBF1 (putative translation factor)